MLILKYATQPSDPQPYSNLVSWAFSEGAHDTFNAAIAYATLSGAKYLIARMTATDAARWNGATKRWLIGIDWCRTDPAALELLAGLPLSKVRIFDGKRVVERDRCVPHVPFHPKMFLLRGTNVRAAVVGSGNLSRNGLSVGYEVGQLLFMRAPVPVPEQSAHAAIQRLQNRFNQWWRGATTLGAVASPYADAYAEAIAQPAPLDDDAVDAVPGAAHVEAKLPIPPDRLLKLRTASHLWIQAGNLHKNRGPGKPGNQLMMSPMTRVFFGFMPTQVPRDTMIGHVTIRYGHEERDDRSLRFSNNSMDVLTLPVPGDGGPDFYDGETLLFVRDASVTPSRFVLRIAKAGDAARWQKRSDRYDATFKMTSGRRWGLF
jgi:hypothetical protein